MPLLALKASWEVTAGLHPGHRIPELCKQWTYTSREYDADVELPDPPPVGTLSQFHRMAKEASDYALSLNDPRRLNYVKLEFLWL